MTQRSERSSTIESRRQFLKTAPLAALMAARLAAESKADARARMPFVDGLCIGVLSSDAEEFRASGLTALIADVSQAEQVKTADGSIRFFRSFEACARSIVTARQRLRKNNSAFHATRGSEIPEAFRSGKCAVFLQFQGCEPIGEDLSRIDLFYELGLRVLQITHHNDNSIGGGCIEKKWSGLTRLGFEAIERMNALGVIPDLSHSSDLTGLDVVKASKKPVIVSHGGARALVNNARCTPDEVISGVARTGGMMGIFMMSFWLTTDPEPTVEALIRQIRHVIKVGGIDAVGIANDFPLTGEPNLVKLNNDNREGVKGYYPWWDSVAKEGVLGFDHRPQHVVIPELNNIRRMFTIQAALERAGFKSREVEKIMGGNWIRVMTESLG